MCIRDSACFHQHFIIMANAAVKKGLLVPRRPFTQGCGTLPDQGTINLGHSGGGRALTRGIGKDMQPGQLGIINQVEGRFMRGIILGRETGNQISPEHSIRANLADLPHQVQHIGCAMAAFHSFQDQIMAMLNRQMQMRHQPVIISQRCQQIIISLGRINR